MAESILLKGGIRNSEGGCIWKKEMKEPYEFKGYITTKTSDKYQSGITHTDGYLYTLIGQGNSSRLFIDADDPLSNSKDGDFWIKL